MLIFQNQTESSTQTTHTVMKNRKLQTQIKHWQRTKGNSNYRPIFECSSKYISIIAKSLI